MYSSIMTLNDLACDKKPDTKTGIGLFCFSFYTVKPFEYFFKIFFIDTDTLVLYPDRGHFAIPVNIYTNAVGIGGIFDSVIKKIRYHLRNTVPVAKYFTVKIALNDNGMPGCGVPDILNHFFDKVSKIKPGTMQFKLTRFNPGK